MCVCIGAPPSPEVARVRRPWAKRAAGATPRSCIDRRTRAAGEALIDRRPGLCMTPCHRAADDPRGLMVVGGKGFDGRQAARAARGAGCRACLPGKPNRKKRRELNKRLHRLFYRMENFFCRLKRRACASARHFNSSSSSHPSSPGSDTALEGFQTRPSFINATHPHRRAFSRNPHISRRSHIVGGFSNPAR